MIWFISSKVKMALIQPQNLLNLLLHLERLQAAHRRQRILIAADAVYDQEGAGRGRRARTVWVKPWLQRRIILGQYDTLMIELMRESRWDFKANGSSKLERCPSGCRPVAARCPSGRCPVPFWTKKCTRGISEKLLPVPLWFVTAWAIKTNFTIWARIIVVCKPSELDKSKFFCMVETCLWWYSISGRNLQTLYVCHVYV